MTQSFEGASSEPQLKASMPSVKAPCVVIGGGGFAGFGTLVFGHDAKRVVTIPSSTMSFGYDVLGSSTFVSMPKSTMPIVSIPIPIEALSKLGRPDLDLPKEVESFGCHFCNESFGGMFGMLSSAQAEMLRDCHQVGCGKNPQNVCVCGAVFPNAAARDWHYASCSFDPSIAETFKVPLVTGAYRTAGASISSGNGITVGYGSGVGIGYGSSYGIDGFATRYFPGDVGVQVVNIGSFGPLAAAGMTSKHEGWLITKVNGEDVWSEADRFRTTQAKLDAIMEGGRIMEAFTVTIRPMTEDERLRARKEAMGCGRSAERIRDLLCNIARQYDYSIPREACAPQNRESGCAITGKDFLCTQQGVDTILRQFPDIFSSDFKGMLTLATVLSDFGLRGGQFVTRMDGLSAGFSIVTDPLVEKKVIGDGVAAAVKLLATVPVTADDKLISDPMWQFQETPISVLSAGDPDQQAPLDSYSDPILMDDSTRSTPGRWPLAAEM